MTDEEQFAIELADGMIALIDALRWAVIGVVLGAVWWLA